MVKLSDFLVEAASSSSQQDMEKNSLRLENTIKYLQTKKKVLLIATSNRWEGHKDDEAKSTKLAKLVAERLGTDKCEFIDASKLNIAVCEGNVSSKFGNHCGEKGALLKDKDKNPSGYHRCWASINNKSDELWKITKPLFESDAVVFFTSIRWGQTNSVHQKLIERLTWIENRRTTLGESDIIKNVDNYESLLYFDKPFLLSQIKLAQESNFLGFSLAGYKEGISNRISTINLSSYEAVYNSNNLAISFGLNSFKDVQQINKEYLETLNGKYNLAGDVISLEIFKHLKEISYLNQSIGSVRNIKELKPLIDQMPAGLVETFNGLLSKVNEDIRELNKFEIGGENFVFNPSLEFMLS